MPGIAAACARAPGGPRARPPRRRGGGPVRRRHRRRRAPLVRTRPRGHGRAGRLRERGTRTGRGRREGAGALARRGSRYDVAGQYGRRHLGTGGLACTPAPGGSARLRGRGGHRGRRQLRRPQPPRAHAPPLSLDVRDPRGPAASARARLQSRRPRRCLSGRGRLAGHRPGGGPWPVEVRSGLADGGACRTAGCA